MTRLVHCYRIYGKICGSQEGLMPPHHQSAAARHLVQRHAITGETAVTAALNVREVPLLMLVDALREALTEFNLLTEDDPRQFRAQVIWAKLVRRLREWGRSLDWRRARRYGFETVVHPSGIFAIAVANGSEGTGDPEGIPATRAPKGRMSANAIAENQLQLSLPGFPRRHDSQAADEMQDRSQRVETWFLLARVSDVDGCMYAELSLPLGPLSSDQGDQRVQISSWHTRIILPVIGQDGSVLRWPGASPANGSGEIDVDVRRKADDGVQRATATDRSDAPSDDQDGAR